MINKAEMEDLNMQHAIQIIQYFLNQSTVMRMDKK